MTSTMKTYVTLLSTVNYLPGVLALNESLRQVESTYPLLVALSINLPSTIRATLLQAGMQVIVLPEGIAVPKKLRDGSGHWNNTFDKLHLFGLTDFRKLVYIDSDMIVLCNIDELFKKPHISAVSAGRLVHTEWDRLNSGLMVIEPEDSLPKKIGATLENALAVAESSGMTAIGDQDLINAYYSTWPSSVELHLEQGYNIFQCHLDYYIEKQGYQLPSENKDIEKTVKIVHFIGPHKPWMKGSSFRHYLNLIRKGRAIKWEHKVYSMYKVMLNKSALPFDGI
jgi:glycogenin glucosyltransferase